MADLQRKIGDLEKIQDQQLTELKQSAVAVMESFSPSNMLKTALKDITQSPGLRNAAIDTAIGMGAGFLGRKLYVGRSSNIFKNITGTALQFLLTNFVRNRMAGAKANTGETYTEV